MSCWRAPCPHSTTLLASSPMGWGSPLGWFFYKFVLVNSIYFFLDISNPSLFYNKFFWRKKLLSEISFFCPLAWFFYILWRRNNISAKKSYPLSAKLPSAAAPLPPGGPQPGPALRRGAVDWDKPVGCFSPAPVSISAASAGGCWRPSSHWRRLLPEDRYSSLFPCSWSTVRSWRRQS